MLDPNDFSVVAVSPVSSYAIGLIVHGVRNEVTVYAAPLAAITGPQTPWKKLLDVDDDVTAFDWRGDTHLPSVPQGRTRTSKCSR